MTQEKGTMEVERHDAGDAAPLHCGWWIGELSTIRFSLMIFSYIGL